MEIKIKFPILIPHFQDFRFSTTMGGLLSSPSWSPSTPVTTTAEADPARADMDKKTTNDNTHQSIKPGDHVCCKFGVGVKTHHGIISEKKLCRGVMEFHVIHLCPNGVREDPLSSFIGESSSCKGKSRGKYPLQVCNYSNDWFWSRWWHKKYLGVPKDAEEVVKEAQDALKSCNEMEDKGAHLYHWMTFNCETFARMCKLGDDARSLQVDQVFNWFFGCVSSVTAAFGSAYLSTFFAGAGLLLLIFRKYKISYNCKQVKRLLCKII